MAAALHEAGLDNRGTLRLLLGPEYVRDVAGVVDAAAGGPLDLAAIAAAMKRHRLTPAP